MTTTRVSEVVLDSRSADLWQDYFLHQRLLVKTNLDWYWERLARCPAEFGVKPETAEAIGYSAIHGGGKRVRGVLVLLVHELVRGTCPEIERATLLPELPRRGSLIEDDIDDHALLRDGKPPVYQMFADGTRIAQEAAAALYDAPLRLLREMQISETTKDRIREEYILLSRMARRGQSMDLTWSRGQSIPSEVEYLEMC